MSRSIAENMKNVYKLTAVRTMINVLAFAREHKRARYPCLQIDKRKAIRHYDRVFRHFVEKVFHCVVVQK